MTDFDRIREEGERISREEGYKVLLAEIAARDKEIDKLREAIRRLADQDATLSVCDGNVTATMDATLTDAEREAVRFAAAAALPETEKLGGVAGELCRMHAATLRGLLERLGAAHWMADAATVCVPDAAERDTTKPRNGAEHARSGASHE